MYVYFLDAMNVIKYFRITNLFATTTLLNTRKKRIKYTRAMSVPKNLPKNIFWNNTERLSIKIASNNAKRAIEGL